MARRSFIAMLLPPAPSAKKGKKAQSGRNANDIVESIGNVVGKGWRGMLFVPPCPDDLLSGLVELSEKRGFIVTVVQPGGRDADFINRRIVNAADGVLIPSGAKATAIRGWCELEGRRVTDY